MRNRRGLVALLYEGGALVVFDYDTAHRRFHVPGGRPISLATGTWDGEHFTTRMGKLDTNQREALERALQDPGDETGTALPRASNGAPL